MSVKAQLDELGALNKEITRLKRELKQKKDRAEHLEAEISAYVISKDLPGVKHRGTAVVLKKSKKAVPRSIRERDESSINVLRDYGVQNPEEVLKNIMKARQSEKVTVDKLKIQRYDKYEKQRHE